MSIELDTIHCGDCLEWLKTLPDGCVDAVVTDPPYGVAFKGKRTKHTTNVGGYVSTNDAPDIITALVLPALVECRRVGKRVVLTPGSRNMFLYPVPEAVGTIFYPSGAGMGRWGFTCWQPIFYYGKDPYLAAGLGSRPDSFQTTQSAPANGHPCPKPVQTMRWMLEKATTHEGQTVLDPFMGSGTTAVACIRMGRHFLGCEISEDYCTIARKRIAAARAEVGLFSGMAATVPAKEQREMWH